MKQFEEDKDSENSYPQNNNGPSDPTLIEQLEKLEESVPFRKFKRYISDAKLTNAFIQTIKKQQSSLNINNTTSDYSEETLTVDNNEKDGKQITSRDIIAGKKIEKKENVEIENDIIMELNITRCIVIKFIFSDVKYEISISEKNSYKTVSRRYCEFENLRKALVNKYVCMYTPPLPGKKLFGYYDQNFLGARKKFLQIFLHELQYLFYYFYDSPEIKAFLDPSVSYYSDYTIPNISNIISMDYEESLIYLTSYAEIAKKTFSYSIQNIHDRIVDALREPFISDPNPGKLANTVIKNYPRKIMKKSQNKINLFVDKLYQQKSIVKNLNTIVEDIKNKEKDFQITQNKFNEQLLLFESEYISNISFGKIKINPQETKEISQQITTINREKPIYILTKNLFDWISREETIIMAYCECVDALNFFIIKDKDVKTEMKVMKQCKNKTKRKEELGKLTRLNHLLNEILIMNTIYIHDVRIDRYSYSRFQLYYNALHFSIMKHKQNTHLYNKIYDLISIQLKRVKVYQILNQKPKYPL